MEELQNLFRFIRVRVFIQTLFPVRCKSCFTLLFLANSYYFDAFLFLIYFSFIWFQSWCTQIVPIHLLLKVIYHHSILSEFKIFIVNLIYRFNIYYKRGMCIIVPLQIQVLFLKICTPHFTP